MRKDVILGMTIGGVMLATAIFYLTLSSSSRHDKHGVETASSLTDGSGGAGDEVGQSDNNAGEYKPSATGSRTIDPAAGKPMILAATTVEKSDPVWGKRLWADSVVTVTPDPNGGPISTDTPTTSVASAGTSTDKASGEIPGGGSNIVVPTDSSTTSRTVAPEKATDSSTTSAPAGKSHIHKVQKGETLSTIAAAAYGSPNLYPYILRANPKVEPTKLKPGMELTLPDVSEVKGSEKAADKSAEKSTDAGTVTHKVGPTIDAKSEYRVQSGDNLNKISIKLYGKLSMVQSIYDLNKSAIGDNPAKLKLGMVLKLPQPPSTTN